MHNESTHQYMYSDIHRRSYHYSRQCKYHNHTWNSPFLLLELELVVATALLLPTPAMQPLQPI